MSNKNTFMPDGGDFNIVTTNACAPKLTQYAGEIALAPVISIPVEGYGAAIVKPRQPVVQQVVVA